MPFHLVNISIYYRYHQTLEFIYINIIIIYWAFVKHKKCNFINNNFAILKTIAFVVQSFITMILTVNLVHAKLPQYFRLYAKASACSARPLPRRWPVAVRRLGHTTTDTPLRPTGPPPSRATPLRRLATPPQPPTTTPRPLAARGHRKPDPRLPTPTPASLPS